METTSTKKKEEDPQMALGASGAFSQDEQPNNDEHRPKTTEPPRATKWAAWVPPPGAFNEPDLPVFYGPGPGRYSPVISLTKARVLAPTFATEDRWKHLGRQRDSSHDLNGVNSSNAVSTWGPQIGLSPGPVYLPTFSAVEVQSRSASFPGQARGRAASVSSLSGTKRPGPGAYSPVEQYAVLSTKPRVGRMSSFSTDDRLKYLGEQLEGGAIIRIASPGPTYAPKLDLVLHNHGGISFGQPRNTGSRPMLLGTTSPGPGSYTPPAQAHVLSTKRSVPMPSFGKERRFSGGMPGESDSLLSRRPTTPGPKYLPNFEYVRPQSRSAKIGTARRFSGSSFL